MKTSSVEKSINDTPTYIVTAQPSCKEEKLGNVGLRKKFIVFAVTTIIVVGLIIAAVLIGIHLVTEAQKEIVQFQLQFKGSDNQNTTQNVVSDPNDNVVVYHVSKPGQDAYVVNDFNKGIQTVKIQTSDGTTCYVTPLNVSTAMDPSLITGPESMTGSSNQANEQPFLLSNTPVVDRSFMTKKAADLCTGISVYWAYRTCAGQPAPDINSTSIHDRSKRTIYLPPYYCLQEVWGCGLIIRACYVRIVQTLIGTNYYCQYFIQTGTCCSTCPLYCNNYYAFKYLY